MSGMVEITIRDPIGSEPKVYRKQVASDDELFDLLDRAAKKYGSKPDADEPLRFARARERVKRGS